MIKELLGILTIVLIILFIIFIAAGLKNIYTCNEISKMTGKETHIC